MSRPLTNLTLGAAVGLALLTGTLAFAVGTAAAGWVLAVVHGVSGLVLVVLALRKLVIARVGWRRQRASRWGSLLLATAAVTAVLSGIAQALGWRDLGVVSAIQIHVPAAILTGIGVAWHMVIHPGPVRQVRAGTAATTSRRAALRTVGVLAGSVVAWGAVEAAAFARRGFDGRRRFTGSQRLDRPLVTQWFTDGVQRIPADSWRLQLRDPAGVRHVTHDALLAHPARRTVAAVIDCTGGWYASAAWSGVPLDALLDVSATAGSIVVTSTSGYRRRLPVEDAATLLLATHMDGEPLSAGHGFPVRLVAPGRRGFWWVKWVEEVVVDEGSWLRQPPFPLR